MGRGVILIRHATPLVTPGTASNLWTLGESAKEDCVLLAHALPKDVAPVVYTSPEPKAAETATVIALRLGLQVQTDARLSEVDRPPVWDDDYRAMVLRYLETTQQPGWEPADAVRNGSPRQWRKRSRPIRPAMSSFRTTGWCSAFTQRPAWTSTSRNSGAN